MTEIVFRLPSKQVQYGYVEVKGSPEDFGINDISDPYGIGIAYTTYVARFFNGEIDGVKAYTNEASEPREQGVGRPVKGVSGVRQVEPEVGSPKAAAERLDKGLKPRTMDEDHAMATELIERELGATVVDEEAAPWEQPASEAKPKPWEASSTSFDFD